MSTQGDFSDSYEEDECYECHGDGVVFAECFEDSCCCANPEQDHNVIPCPVCG